MFEPLNVNVRFHDDIIQFLNPNTGTEIDSYKLYKNIAKSNEWHVWKGERTSYNEQAAIKCITIPPDNDLKIVAMNELRINAWAQKSNPIGLQRVFGCYVDPIQGDFFCVAAFYPTPFHKFLVCQETGQAVLSLIKLAATLNTLQSKYQFMHRDLHLGNVLYDSQEQIPILTDFGNAFVGTIPLQCDDKITYRPDSVQIFNQQHDLRLFVVSLWEHIRFINAQNDLASILMNILEFGRNQSPIFDVCFDDEFVSKVCRDYKGNIRDGQERREPEFRERHQWSLSLWKKYQGTPKISIRNLMYDGMINCDETTCFVPPKFGELLGFHLSQRRLVSFSVLAPYMKPFTEETCSYSLIHKSRYKIMSCYS